MRKQRRDKFPACSQINFHTSHVQVTVMFFHAYMCERNDGKGRRKRERDRERKRAFCSNWNSFGSCGTSISRFILTELLHNVENFLVDVPLNFDLWKALICHKVWWQLCWKYSKNLCMCVQKKESAPWRRWSCEIYFYRLKNIILHCILCEDEIGWVVVGSKGGIYLHNIKLS